MHVKILSIIILNLAAAYSQITQIEQNLLIDSVSNCKKINTEEKFAVSGWPFTLNCADIFKNTTNLTYAQCYSSLDAFRTILFSNESMVVTNESDVTTFNVAAIFNETYCLRSDILVKTIPIFNGTSYDAIQNDVKHNRSIEAIVISFQEKANLLCIPPLASDISQLLLPPGFVTTWWRTKLFPNNTYQPEASIGFRNFSKYLPTTPHGHIIHNNGEPDEILLYQAFYFHPGLYSCQLEYDNQQAMITHLSVCVQTRINYGDPTIMCSEEVLFFKNENIVINCSVHTSNAEIDSGHLMVEWNKSGQHSTICSNSYDRNLNITETNEMGYSCRINNFTNLAQRCFNYGVNKILAKYPNKKTFQVQLIIKDIEKSQAGTYQVRLYYDDKWSEYFSVKLEFNPERELRLIVSILAGVLGFLIIVALGVLFVWWQWVQILLFVRRHIGKYDEDGKEFVAILSYVYSLDLPEDTRNTTKKIVQCIQDRMKEMNYRFYDSHKDFDQGSTVENLLKYLNESHRMIVILTDAYVAERWSRFEAQQGFFNMLKNRTKLIFVRTPGAKQALSKCKRKGDDFSKELDEAMKASRNIRWHSQMSENRFKDHVQYALPNLKRTTETSLGEYQKLDHYERSISRQTQVSVLSGSLNEFGQKVSFEKSSETIIV